jgi:CopG family nickel-responsive transcriptional regulator
MARDDRTTRFTISLPDALMGTLERLRAGRTYANRSEFIRDLLRAELVKEQWTARRGATVGVLVLIYDHDAKALADKLTDIQHKGFRAVTAALHVHLDAHTCLEVIVLRGRVRAIRAVADQLVATKGVRYGQLVPAAARGLA